MTRLLICAWLAGASRAQPFNPLAWPRSPQMNGSAPFQGPSAVFQLWLRSLGASTYASVALAPASADAPGGTLYVLRRSRGGSDLTALFANNGSVRWRFAVPAAGGAQGIDGGAGGAPLVAADGSIFFTADTPALYKVSASGVGAVCYALPAGQGLPGLIGPRLSGAPGAVYFGTSGGQGLLVKVRASDCTLITAKSMPWMQSTPTLAPDGSALFIVQGWQQTCCAGYVKALDTATLAPVWNSVNFTLSSTDRNDAGSVVVSSDGSALYAMSDSHLHIISNPAAAGPPPQSIVNARLPAGVQVTSLATGAMVTTPSIDGSGAAYFGTSAALCKVTLGGAASVLYTTAAPISGQTLNDAAGALFAGDTSGTAWGISSNGSLMWTFRELGNGGIWAAPAIDSAGTLYFADVGGNVFALAQAAVPSPAASPAPKAAALSNPLNRTGSIALLSTIGAIVAILLVTAAFFCSARACRVACGDLCSAGAGVCADRGCGALCCCVSGPRRVPPKTSSEWGSKRTVAPNPIAVAALAPASS